MQLNHRLVNFSAHFVFYSVQDSNLRTPQPECTRCKILLRSYTPINLLRIHEFIQPLNPRHLHHACFILNFRFESFCVWKQANKIRWSVLNTEVVFNSDLNCCVWSFSFLQLKHSLTFRHQKSVLHFNLLFPLIHLKRFQMTLWMCVCSGVWKDYCCFADLNIIKKPSVLVEFDQQRETSRWKVKAASPEED